MEAVAETWLFPQQQFTVMAKDPDGVKFNRVSRFVAVTSGDAPLELLIDINISLFPLAEGSRFGLALSSTLDPTGGTADGLDPSVLSVADDYDYVMHGKVYRCEPLGDRKLGLYISFGGLLLRLKGDAEALASVELDSMVYVLLKAE